MHNVMSTVLTLLATFLFLFRHFRARRQEDNGLAFCSAECRDLPDRDSSSSSPQSIIGAALSSSSSSSSPSFRYKLVSSAASVPRNGASRFTRSGNGRVISANFLTSSDTQFATTYNRSPLASIGLFGDPRPDSDLTDNLAHSSAIYRDCYPKFATRSLARRSPMQTLVPAVSSLPSLVVDSDSPSSDALPPTPPLMRRCKTNPVSTTTVSFMSPLSSNADVASKQTLPHRSPFLHIPERRAAPKRSIELSSSPQPRSRTLPFTLPSDNTSTAGTSVAPLPRSNALGLELEHIESVAIGRSNGVWAATPPTGCNSPARMRASHLKAARKSHQGSRGSNPISPPSCRSPLVSIQIANALADMDMQDEGRRSVEASAYVLGEREAMYIARRLAEEQRRRATREREKAAMDKVQQETRGRSRDRKRANSWSADRRLHDLQTM